MFCDVAKCAPPDARDQDWYTRRLNRPGLEVMSAAHRPERVRLAPHLFDRLNHLSKQRYSLSCGRHTDAQLSALEFVVTGAYT
jgi:hypothetical protein